MWCSIYYINTNEIPNHFTETVFSRERRDLLCSHSNRDIFTCENNMLFSRLKISCFRAKAHLVFHWCLHNKGYSLFTLHYLYLGILFNSTALILKLEFVVVNWFVGNQHTLGVFIWQNFASGRMFLKESMQVVLDHRLFPSSQSP